MSRYRVTIEIICLRIIALPKIKPAVFQLIPSGPRPTAEKKSFDRYRRRIKDTNAAVENFAEENIVTKDHSRFFEAEFP